MWLWLFIAMAAAHESSTVTFLGQECDDAVTPQVYVKGGQPGEKVKDLAQCVKLCEASSDCESVTFYHRESWTDANKKTHAEEKWCKHFYAACGGLKKAGGATTVTHLANLNSYWSLASIGYGRKCQGTPLSSGKQDSLAKCMTACDSEPDCKSVTFSLSDKTCAQFSTKCEKSTTSTNDKKQDTVSMIRRTDHRGALQSKCDTGKGVDGLPREKYLKSLAVADLAACEKSCNNDAKCQSITFRKKWSHNCIHYETKCLYRQPESDAIAKSLELKNMPTSTSNKGCSDVDKQKIAFCKSPGADCAYRCKPGFNFANFTADKSKFGKCSEVKCPAYKTFPTGVEGGVFGPCKPAAGFQLSSTTNHWCSLKCKAGFEQKGGKGVWTLWCGINGKLRGGELTCTDVNECAKNNGGCDSKRKCENTAGSMKCGDCPAGYTNDGAKGCKG